MDVVNGPSLRLRGGVNNHSDSKKHELNLCTSVMSLETKRLLPPTSETIMTKPFPIRGLKTSAAVPRRLSLRRNPFGHHTIA